MKLFKHQKEEVELLSENSAFALFAEQGTGKTIPMLKHISDLIMIGEVETCLIVAPLSGLGAWERDIEKFDSFRKALLKKAVTLINYDKVWRREEYYKPYDCLVLDEAHAIAYLNSNRTRFFLGYKRGKKEILGLNKMCKYKYLLTGTPISNGKLEQYYPLLEFLRPGILNTYNEFRARYLTERQIPGTYATFIVGYRNKEELLKLVSRYSYRVTKKECLDLPEKLPDEVIYCDLQEKKLYKSAEKDMYVEALDLIIPNPLSLTVKARQICSGAIIDEFGTTHELKCDKDKMLLEMIESLGGRKIVVFCEFTASINKIKTALDKNKITYLELSGQQKDKKIWKKFQDSNDYQVMITQYKSGCSAIDLFTASYMVFYEPPLSTTTIEQARDRIHRIGQNEACNYYWFITKDTIEEDIYKRLVNKQDCNSDWLKQIAEYRKSKL